MFGIGFTELIVILIVFLIVGPQKFPEMIRTLGRILMEFRSAADEVTREIQSAVDLGRGGFEVELTEQSPKKEEQNAEIHRTS